MNQHAWGWISAERNRRGCEPQVVLGELTDAIFETYNPHTRWDTDGDRFAVPSFPTQSSLTEIFCQYVLFLWGLCGWWMIAIRSLSRPRSVGIDLQSTMGA